MEATASETVDIAVEDRRTAESLSAYVRACFQEN